MWHPTSSPLQATFQQADFDADREQLQRLIARRNELRSALNVAASAVDHGESADGADSAPIPAVDGAGANEAKDAAAATGPPPGNAAAAVGPGLWFSSAGTSFFKLRPDEIDGLLRSELQDVEVEMRELCSRIQEALDKRELDDNHNQPYNT